jgi:hypothetical protein
MLPGAGEVAASHGMRGSIAMHERTAWAGDCRGFGYETRGTKPKLARGDELPVREGETMAGGDGVKEST